MTRDEYLRLAQEQTIVARWYHRNIALLDRYESEHPDEPKHDEKSS